jgi:DNA uptake protein ComE-like DNA-binding protein
MAWPGNEPPTRPPYQPHPPYRPYPPRGWRPHPPMPPGPPPSHPLPPMPPRPLPPMPPEPPHSQGVLWALTPLLTAGLATPFTFTYAAVRRRSAGLAASSAAYFVGWGAAFAFMDSGWPLSVLASMLMMILWLGGSVHALAVRTTVYPRRPPRDRANEHAVHVAKHRRTLREEARALAAEDPALAHEVGIGRPDVPRAYDDGGLIDINHAPPFVLALLPGMTSELVERIDRIRREQGPFVSVEELAVNADLPPDLVPRLGEYAIFLP